MSYKVIKAFTDLQDDLYSYKEGDTYPRKGLEVTPERFAELASNENKQGTPLIVEVKTKAKKTADK